MSELSHQHSSNKDPLAAAYGEAANEHNQIAQKHEDGAESYRKKGQRFRAVRECLKARLQRRNAEADCARAGRSSDEYNIPNSQEPKGVDLAALLGATIAVLVTLTFGPGAWGPLSTIIGSLLLVVLLTFFWRRRISAMQRRVSPEKLRVWESFLVGLALSAVIGLVGAITSAEAIQNLVFGDHANRFECRSVAVAQATMAVRDLNVNRTGNGLLRDLINERLNPGNQQSGVTKQTNAAVRFAFHDEYESAIGNCLAVETADSLWPIGLSCAALTLLWWNWNLIPLLIRRFPADLKQLSHRGGCPLVCKYLTAKR
jgi:hypothetical protein